MYTEFVGMWKTIDHNFVDNKIPSIAANKRNTTAEPDSFTARLSARYGALVVPERLGKRNVYARSRKNRPPKTVFLESVEGHQREKYPDREPSRQSVLNDRADEIATAELENITHHRPQVPFIPVSRLRLTIDGTAITHHIPTHIRTACGKKTTSHSYASTSHGYLKPTTV
jgi:hypothetical protein